MKHSHANSSVPTRRQFIAATTAAALAAAGPRLVSAAEAVAKPAESGPKIKLGLIGCGGRGSWIADLFGKHGGYTLVAVADYFPDRVNACGDKFKIDPSRRYTGLSAYKKLLESDVDAVAIESPPYFHPEQAAAAVDAGKHVYLAKPIAVDVPGCRTVEESGRKATAGNLAFLVDFQTRANPFYIEAIKHVHSGSLGTIAFGEAAYHGGRLGAHGPVDGSPESRLRNWVFDIALSGDVMTEQFIHAMDVATWIMDAAPLSAAGAGGRTIRTDVGDCWDHFELLYRFPNKVPVTFAGHQFGNSHGEGITCRAWGGKGHIDTRYGGQVIVFGQPAYRGGDTGSIYRDGAIANIAAFHAQIAAKQFANATVAPSVRSTLTTILGRDAAYESREMTWDEMMKTARKLQPDLKGLKA